MVAALAPSFGPAATVGRRRRSASLVRSPPRLALSRRRPSSLSAAAAAAAHVDPGGYNNEDIHEDAGASEEDFSWRLLEGSNVHVARHHRRGDDANGRRVRRESPRRESVLDLDAVERFSARRGMKKQHVARVYRELFRRGRASFNGAPDVGTEDMKALDEAFAVTTSEVVEHKVTSDGTGACLRVCASYAFLPTTRSFCVAFCASRATIDTHRRLNFFLTIRVDTMRFWTLPRPRQARRWWCGSTTARSSRR